MIEQNVFIPNATAKQVYGVLLSSELHSKLTGDKAVVSDKVCQTFSTFDGYAEGKNLELVPGQKIVQSWRASDWPDGHYSTIYFYISDSKDGARIDFKQENIPDGREDEYIAGWKDNYWSRLKDFFE